jgi:hypothetical protein
MASITDKEFPMPLLAPTHQLTNPVTAFVHCGDRKKLECLNRGSILTPTAAPDRAGMIEATCGDRFVIVFRRDLEDSSIEVG